MRISVKLSFVFLFFIISEAGFAQKDSRIDSIKQKLQALTGDAPGLNETVDFSVTGVTIQEFLRGIAESHNLNISIDPSINFKIYNNFTNAEVINVLIYLVREYDLDITFQGSIMSFHKYIPPASPKAQSPPRDIRVKYSAYSGMLSLDLQNDTLDQVAKKITQITKKNVVLSSSVLKNIVSVYIEDMPFDNALEKMAFANDLKVIKTDDNFYLIQALEENELPAAMISKIPTKNKKINKTGTSASAGTGAGGNAPASNADIEITDSLGKKYITFTSVNYPISDAIKVVSEEADMNYFLFSEIKGNVTTRISRVVFQDFIAYLLQGTAYTFKVENKLYLIGDRQLEGLRENRIYQFQFRGYSEVHDVIPAEIKKGVEIKEFKELNSILLTGSLPQILEVEAFLRKVDKSVPVVLIDVIMIDISRARTVKTGISAGLSDTVTAGGSILPGPNFVFSSSAINNFLSGIPGLSNIGRVTPSFYLGISALETNGNTDVRSMPRLSTLNGHDATLSIGSTRYYSQNTQNIIGSVTTTTSVTQQYHPIQANLSVTIKPLVSGDDQVTLDVEVKISDFLNTNVTGPPPTSNSQFKSTIRVRNEEMVVLGGLERMEKNESTSGVPLLSRIPVLKWIFSARTKTRNKTVTILFIKPTILY